MDEEIQEQRRYKRFYFSVEDGLVGVFRIGKKQNINASIMNLSAGGLFFVLEKNVAKKINVGQRVLLKEVLGDERLDFLRGIEMEIRWMAEINGLNHTGYGCEFLNVTKEAREKISEFVDFEILLKGQHDKRQRS
jgi:c-di-GMP-binding flagellar brake protein YcgR